MPVGQVLYLICHSTVNRSFPCLCGILSSVFPSNSNREVRGVLGYEDLGLGAEAVA